MFHAVYDLQPTKPSLKLKLRRMVHRCFKKTFWHKSWSQFGEDRYIAQLTKTIHTGFYVDVGAFDPEKFSNTRALFERGWRGVNIDMSPSKLGVFEYERPGDINVIAPISDTDDTLEVYIFSQASILDTLSSALDTLSKEAADGWSEQFGLPYETKPMKAIRLDDLLAQVDAPTKIDFMNIDVEGAEMNVLRSVSFERYEVGVIAIEIHTDFAGLTEAEPYRYLLERGYTLEAWMHPTAILRRQVEG